jgi:GTP-binding protein
MLFGALVAALRLERREQLAQFAAALGQAAHKAFVRAAQGRASLFRHRAIVPEQNESVHFIDEITIEVHAGDGGDGSAAMRREKHKPLAGPAGGDGGNGGDIVFEADPRLTTLLDLKQRRVLKAERGEHGRGKDQYGKGGASLTVRVPVGTQVFDADTGELLADLARAGEAHVAARGGRGGRGNLHFVTQTERAPAYAEPGAPGEQRKLRLELKLLADVGLVGFPNVGKSTLISAVSRARPKIADYPFTTLAPNLGVVSRGQERSFVVADIPGIIEGAAEGAGLGLRFLKHIERTRVLVHLVSVDPSPGREPLADYDTLTRELERFDPALAGRPALIAMSKLDLPEVRAALPEFQSALAARGLAVHAFSAATREGVDALLDAVEALLARHPVPSQPRNAPLPRSPGGRAKQH